MPRSFLAGLLVGLQLYVLPFHLFGGQQPPLTPDAQQVKTQVQNIPIGGKLTVNLLNGKEYYGNLSSTDAESFTMREVDLKQTLTLQYAEVQKVRKDYGRPGFGGRRVHPHRSLITGLIIVAALVSLVVVAVASDKS